MAAIVRVLARAFSQDSAPQSLESEILKQIMLFCGAGLLVSLLMMTYGVDLSVGFF